MGFSCFDNSNFDYNSLVNKPCVNGKVMTGDMSFEDMGIIDVVECYTQCYAECCIYPTVDCCLMCKQDTLTPGLGICIDSDSCISVVADSSIDSCSENAIMNCTVAVMCCGVYCCIADERCCTDCQLSGKQDKLEAGTAINITCCLISVCIDCAMSCTSENPVMNCTINNAIDCIMSCGYQAGNGIQMTTDCCGNHVISLADCVAVACDLSVQGSSTLCGPLTIWGDIYQCGSAYCTHAEEVFSKCDCIILRDGNLSPLAAGTTAGFVALHYNGTDCALLGVDSTGTWRLGETDGDPNQPIATRSETCDTLDKAIAVWNCISQCFETAHSSDGQEATWDDCVIPSLQTSCSANHTKIKGEITNSDKVTMHDYQSFQDLEADIALEAGEFSRYDNVAGVSCCFCLPNVYAWAQCDCCVDYSTLSVGTASSAAVCQDFTIPMDGSAPTATETTNSTFCSCYGMCFHDDFNKSVLSLCSCEEELYDELETFTATAQSTFRCIGCYSYTPNKSGAVVDGAYSATDLTSDPSWCNVCVSELCYYIDDLGVYCDQCCYYCYDSGSLTYCDASIDAESYVPGTYYFRCECAFTETQCFDLKYGSGGVSCSVCGPCFLGGSCQLACCFSIYRSFTNGPACETCSLTADTMCMVYTCCYPILAVNACIVEQNVRLSVCEAGNGRDYLVHTYGLAGCYLEQSRTYQGDTSVRHCCCCLNNAQWTDWTDTSRQSAHVGTPRFLQFAFHASNRKSLLIKADTHIPLKIRNSRTGHVTETRWLDVENDTIYDMSAKITAAAAVDLDRTGQENGKTFWVYLVPTAQGGIDLAVSTRRDCPSDIDASYTEWNTLLIGCFDTLCWSVEGGCPGTTIRRYAVAAGCYSVGDMVKTKPYNEYDRTEKDYADFYTRAVCSVDTTCCTCAYAMATMQHALACFDTGDILPEAVWSCSFHPTSCCWGGKAYIKGSGKAVNIYLSHFDNECTTSKFLNLTAAAAYSMSACHTLYSQVVEAAMVGDAEVMDFATFVLLADGSPSRTVAACNALGCAMYCSYLPCYAGATVACNCQRIVSDIGVEDITGSIGTMSICADGTGSSWVSPDSRGCIGLYFGSSDVLTFGSTGANDCTSPGPRAICFGGVGLPSTTMCVAYRGMSDVVCCTTFAT